VQHARRLCAFMHPAGVILIALCSSASCPVNDQGQGQGQGQGQRQHNKGPKDRHAYASGVTAVTVTALPEPAALLRASPSVLQPCARLRQAPGAAHQSVQTTMLGSPPRAQRAAVLQALQPARCHCCESHRFQQQGRTAKLQELSGSLCPLQLVLPPLLLIAGEKAFGHDPAVAAGCAAPAARYRRVRYCPACTPTASLPPALALSRLNHLKHG